MKDFDDIYEASARQAWKTVNIFRNYGSMPGLKFKSEVVNKPGCYAPQEKDITAETKIIEPEQLPEIIEPK